MHAKDRDALAARTVAAAEALRRQKGYVAPIDVMMAIGWLQPHHVLEWRTLRASSVEQGIQTNPKKVALALRLLADWAREAGLTPSTGEYVARTAARERLQFSATGSDALEELWRTHWISPDLSPSARTRVDAAARKEPEIVAIEPRDPDWRCHSCQGTSPFLVMQPPGPTCLPCAGLGGLEFLPAGNTLLTRRARAGG